MTTNQRSKPKAGSTGRKGSAKPAKPASRAKPADRATKKTPSPSRRPRAAAPASPARAASTVAPQPFDAELAIRLLSADVARLYDLLGSLLTPPATAKSPDSKAPFASLPPLQLPDPEATQPPGPDQRPRPTPSFPSIFRGVGGEKTSDFPAVCCLGDTTGRWIASGVLIAPQVVLTAAHVGRNVYRVHLGIDDTNDPQQIGVIRLLKRTPVQHPDYSSRDHSHDLMLLFLDAQVSFQPLPLAQPDDFARAQAMAPMLSLVGFGYNDPVRPLGFGVKREVLVPIDPAADPAAKGYDPSIEFVAGRKYLGRDACKGDSGGPILWRAGSSACVLGITSRATGDSTVSCGDGGIYTRVDAHLDWIAAELARL